MKNLFCCFLEQIQLIFNYQHWYRWVVGAIIIFAFDYQMVQRVPAVLWLRIQRKRTIM